jgi:hypothetical protein
VSHPQPCTGIIGGVLSVAIWPALLAERRRRQASLGSNRLPMLLNVIGSSPGSC